MFAARLVRGSGDEAERCCWGEPTEPATSEVLAWRDAWGVVCSLPVELKDASTGVDGSICVGDSVFSDAITPWGAGSV